MDLHTCPVCGWDRLVEPPYDWNGSPSYEICPCCGFEFGFDDLANRFTFDSYRTVWIARGMPWYDPSAKPPLWDAEAQLRRVVGGN